jgi:hypothetical protein
MPAWERMSGIIEEFKKLIQKADKEALINEDIVPPKTVEQIESCFTNISEILNDEIGDESTQNVHIKEDLGHRLQREILPYLLLTKTAERTYSKTLGYGGDFRIIDWIYNDQPDGSGRLGPLLDRCFLNLPVFKSIKNQRKLITTEIHTIIKASKTAHITGIASGPAHEIFNVFSKLKNLSDLSVTLIDVDLQALAYVSETILKKKLNAHIKLITGNLVYLAANMHETDVKDQDLVYCLWLANYFDDKSVVALLNYTHKLLRTGGKVILGILHKKNPDKAFLDYVLDWRLNHRTENDMDRMFSTSAFKKECTDISFEEEGIILFASCIK